MADKVRPRAAYRAVYLASPLKFHTTFHAFNRTVPQFNIDNWQKDPAAYEKHKWRTTKDRSHGRWSYSQGPLAGFRLEGWPDPGLLGAADLVQIAARAQAEKLEDRSFWEQVAERTFKLRDIVSVSDLAVILDAMVTANHRHLLLMKTLAREILDDVDKLSLVEAAVVASAYSHFRCVAPPLLAALNKHVVSLLSDTPPPFVQPGGNLDSDPGSVTVIARAMTTLNHATPELMQALLRAAETKISVMTFPDIANFLEAFAKAKVPLDASPEFWQAVISKVPGSRMASLCPALRAMAVLKVDQQSVREALVSEILVGIQKAPPGEPPRPFGSAFDMATPFRFPSFGPPQYPLDFMGLLDPSPAKPEAVAADATEENAEFGGAVGEGDIIEDSIFGAPPKAGTSNAADQPSDSIFAPPPATLQSDFATMDGEIDDMETAPERAPRLFNAVARQPWLPEVSDFRGFDATTNLNRNRRGFRVGEALEGLHHYWAMDEKLPVSLANSNVEHRSGTEIDLLLAASPVLRSALEGLNAEQLTCAAELYARLDDDVADDTVEDLVQESVRKLATFSSPQLRRLWIAAATCEKLSDPYLEKARRRRFPKELRRELRHQENAGKATPTLKKVQRGLPRAPAPPKEATAASKDASSPTA